MKICLHTNFQINQNYIGGTERFLIKLAKELTVLGHSPFIVCSSMQEQTYVEGIKVFGRIPKNYIQRIQKYGFFSSDFLKNEIFLNNKVSDSLSLIAQYTEEQLNDIEADVYHLNSFVSASFFNPSGRNVIVTNHENNLEYNSYWGEGFFEQFTQLVKDKKTNLHKIKLLTPSSYYATYFSNAFNLCIHNIKLGVQLNDFYVSEQVNDIKKEYFGDKDGFIILLPSRLKIIQKGHDIAIKACSILKKRNINFKLIITGIKRSTEKYVNDFRCMLKDNDIEDSVVLSSYSDILNAYNNCDVVISPERYCSYGLSISESLSLGINTILSDIPTYKEIAQNFKHAHFFESENYYDLADKLILVLSQINLQKRNMSEAIRFRCEYDIRDCAKAYSEIYMNL